MLADVMVGKGLRLGAGCEPLSDVGAKLLLRLLVFERFDAALGGHVDPLLGELLRDRRVGDLASDDRGGARCDQHCREDLRERRIDCLGHSFLSRWRRRVAPGLEQTGVEQIRWAGACICADQCERDLLGGHSDVGPIGLEHLISYSTTVVLKSVTSHNSSSVRCYVIGLLGAPNAAKRRKSSVFAVKPLGRRPVR